MNIYTFASHVHPEGRVTVSSDGGPEGGSGSRVFGGLKAAGRFGTALWVSVSLLSPAVLARQAGQKGQKTGEAQAAAPQPESEGAAILKAAERAQALQRVRGFAEQFFEMKRADVRVVSVARLADLLWKDDEGAARQLFARALEMC